MGLGYEGYATIKVNSITELVLCTGAAVPKARVRLESSSGYGGKIDETSGGSGDYSEMGVGLPRAYDWVQYDGNISFDIHEDLFTNQISPWVFDRQSKAEIVLQSRAANEQEFLNCFWNNITMSAADGNAVNGSISFVALERDTYTVGGDYEANKEGENFLCNVPSGWNVPEPLNPHADFDKVPVPFWRSRVVINGTLQTFTTWNVDLSQEVVKFFACEHNANPVEPKWLAVGPMTATFTGDYMSADTFTFTAPDTLTSLYIHIADQVLKLEDLELTSAPDPVQDQNALTPLSVEYAAYELVA